MRHRHENALSRYPFVQRYPGTAVQTMCLICAQLGGEVMQEEHDPFAEDWREDEAMTKEVRPKGEEVRLVAMTEAEFFSVTTLVDQRWDAGITEEEARETAEVVSDDCGYSERDTELARVRGALERLLANAEHIFDKKPVRDWDETLHEA